VKSERPVADRIVAHLGFAKAGSTAIRTWMDAAAQALGKRGWTVHAGTEAARHAWTLSRIERLDPAAAAFVGSLHSSASEKTSEVELEHLRDEMKESGRRKLLVSSEHLHLVRKPAETFARFVGDGTKIDLLLCVRPRPELINSLASELVYDLERDAETAERDALAYDFSATAVIDAWKDVPGTSLVIRDARKGAVAALAEIVGDDAVGLVEEPIVNRKLPAAVAMALFEEKAKAQSLGEWKRLTRAVASSKMLVGFGDGPVVSEKTLQLAARLESIDDFLENGATALGTGRMDEAERRRAANLVALTKRGLYEL
jgi:hypothetical protein